MHITLPLLVLQALAHLYVSNIPSQEHSREHYKSNTGADGTGVVWPRRAEEAGVPIVTRWNNGDCGGALKSGPSINSRVSHYGKEKGGKELTHCVCSR